MIRLVWTANYDFVHLSVKYSVYFIEKKKILTRINIIYVRYEMKIIMDENIASLKIWIA